jgi:hypothetical protein
MARGPFSVDPNSIRPIEDVQLTEGRTIRDTTKEDQAAIRAAENAKTNATTRLVGSVAGFVGQAAGLANNIAEARAVAQAQEEITTVRDSLMGESQFPSLEESAFGKEAQENPDFQATLGSMKKIRSAQRTGRLNRDYAVERINEVVASAKSRNPAFSAEIEKAARDILGFSPQQEFTKQLLRVTPQEQARQALEEKAFRLGITPEDVQTLELSAEQVTLQKNRYELMKLKGTYDANLLGQETRTATALVYTQIADNIAAQIAQGGVGDPASTKSFIQQQFGAQRARLLANMPTSVDASAVNAHVTTLTNEENRLLTMVDNGSIFKFMQQQKDLFIATAEQDLMNTPVLGKTYAVFGAEAGADILLSLSRFKDNPQALQGVFQTGGQGAAELNLGLMLEGVNGGIDVVTGVRPPANENEARVSAWLATKQLQSGNVVDANGVTNTIDGTQAVRLVDVLKGAGQDVTVAAFNDPRVVKTISATKETHGQLINLVDSYQGILAKEYADLQARGEIPTGVLEVQNGVIVDTGQTQQAVSRGQTPTRLGSGSGGILGSGGSGNAAYARWVSKANRLIKLGETYKATGVLPSTAYADPNELLKTLVTGVQPSGETVPTPTTVVNWGVDENGMPVPIDD